MPPAEGYGLASLPQDLSGPLEFRVIVEPGEWLNTAYQMLAEQFQPDVLDPLERYVEWLALNRARSIDSPTC